MIDDPGTLDFSQLRRLRERFLSGDTSGSSYWTDAGLLKDYHRTFGQRILWKWKFVLDDLDALGWRLPASPLVDWGCGSGAASEAILSHRLSQQKSPTPRQLLLWDASAIAMSFAETRLKDQFHSESGVKISRVSRLSEKNAFYLISHVMSELTDEALSRLVDVLRTSSGFIWVESGDYDVSRRLIGIRETLIADFYPVAPCFHRNHCGMLSPDASSHWCHHEAVAPSEVFTSGFWSAVSHECGIDLRSLPLSYLVMTKDPPSGHVADRTAPVFRRLSGTRLTKGEVRVVLCTEENVRDVTVQKRDYPSFYKLAKKDLLPSRLSGSIERHRFFPVSDSAEPERPTSSI